MRILIVDDEHDSCDGLAAFVRSIGHIVDTAYSGKQALECIAANPAGLVISDVSMPGMSGIDLARTIREKFRDTEVILISGNVDIIPSINAIDLGIYDFIPKPIDINRLAELLSVITMAPGRASSIAREHVSAINSLINAQDLITVADYTFRDSDFIDHKSVGHILICSDPMKNVFRKIGKLYEYPDIPILIQGETGTGKELIARSIHYGSSRRDNTFIAINCSTINRDMFEAELFGYVGGSFTGSDPKGRDGKIKAAENGTLFLDEITEIPLDLQAKLLRVLQEKEYYKVGGTVRQQVNTRIVCATNRDIRKNVTENFFREDLYYRLTICKVVIPPLREQIESIIPFAFFFINEINRNYNKDIRYIESAALRQLRDYAWPGNVRELKNLLMNIILFNQDNTIRAAQCAPLLPATMTATEPPAIPSLFNGELPDEPFSLEELNQTIVRKALERFEGNKTKAAQFLGLSRNQLYRRFRF